MTLPVPEARHIYRTALQMIDGDSRAKWVLARALVDIELNQRHSKAGALNTLLFVVGAEENLSDMDEEAKPMHVLKARQTYKRLAELCVSGPRQDVEVVVCTAWFELLAQGSVTAAHRIFEQILLSPQASP